MLETQFHASTFIQARVGRCQILYSSGSAQQLYSFAPKVTWQLLSEKRNPILFVLLMQLQCDAKDKNSVVL